MVVVYNKILKLYEVVYQALARKASRFILRIIYRTVIFGASLKIS